MPASQVPWTRGSQTRFQSVIFGRATVIFSAAENRAFSVSFFSPLCSHWDGFKEQPHNGVFVLGLSYLGEGAEALGGLLENL